MLYFEDSIVGPHLELLRNVCEPMSKSRPHVTVRFFDKLSIPKNHLKIKVKEIDLVAPGAYGLDVGANQKNKTIFIKCQSDELLSLEHKPDFPTSQFHITLYNGQSRDFAEKILGILKKYSWGFRVELPFTKLKAIEIKSRRSKSIKTIGERKYAIEVSNLFKEISGSDISEKLLISLTEKQRLKYSDQICKKLHSYSKKFQKIEISKEKETSDLAKPHEEDYDIHLTPPELAQDIAKYSLKILGDVPVNFGDPAVGTGAFFSALLEVNGRESIQSAIGIDISPKQVDAAKWRWKSRDMDIREGDYLHMEELPTRNLILANPPYLRHQGIPAKYKEELRQRASCDIGVRVSARSGQYVYFILLSHKWMQSGAVAAWLIPSEFMQTGYGKALRYYFSKKVQLVRIHQFDTNSPQFENAEVLPCVVFFRNSKPDPKNKVIFSMGGTISSPSYSEKVGEERFHPEKKWSLRPIIEVERDERYVKLGDIFSVRRGIATGANSFFVLKREQAMELGLPDSELTPLLPKAMNLPSEIIERKSDGYPDLVQQFCVLNSSLTEAEIEKKYPKLMQYLLVGKANGVLERHLVSRRKPWYKQEQREPAPFLCTYMGKAHAGKPAIRFILNKSDAIATNTYLLLYPNENLLSLIKKNPSINEEIFEILKKSTWLAMDEHSRKYAGGLAKIEPKELLEVWLGPCSEEILKLVNGKLF